jgi:dolichol-phosphate mannosyltransferase
MLLSIISPIYKGEKMLDELVSRIKKAVENITHDYEIVLVNDCSPDASWQHIKEICAVDPKIKGINLSRNFGQHYAITAGLKESTGEWVVVMDCDLQDCPEEVPRLYTKAQEGYDTVFAQRVERKDTVLKRFSSLLFNKVFAFLTDQEQDKTVGNFGIYHRPVIDGVLSMGDSIRWFPIMVKWVGFTIGYMPVHHAERAEGKSSYSFKRLLSVAFDNMIAFSNKPLRLMLNMGFAVVVLSIALAFFYFIRYLTGGIVVSGFATIIISMWMLGGIIIMLIGMTGIYIGKTYDKAKDRPLYIIREKLNFDSSSTHEDH